METVAKLGVFRGLFSSVFVKLTALIALTSVAMVITMVWLLQATTAKIASQGVLVLAEEITSTLASQVGGAIRFGNSADLERNLTLVLDRSEGMAQYAFVVDIDGNVLATAGASEVGIQDIEFLASVAMQTAEYSYTNDGLYAASPVLFGNTDPQVIGAVAMIWTADEAKAFATEQKNIAAFTSLGILAVLLVISALILRQFIAKPLERVSSLVADLEEKNFSVDIKPSKRRDEIGLIMTHLASLKGALHSAEQDREDVKRAQQQQDEVVSILTDGLQALANGDLSETINTPFPEDYEDLRNNYNTTIASLSKTIVAVINSASTIRDGAIEISQSSDDLSQRTETQAATLEETAAALEEMTASVKSAASGAKEVENIATKAIGTAEDGQGVVRSAVVAMAEIEESSNKIGQIISVIDDIAFQTNLLALNAGVEAARAGEAGRGFAVVASEVRALAQRSSDAAKEIKTLIHDSSLQVGQGVKLVDQAGDELQKIVSSVENIATLIGNMAEGSTEQSSGISEINLGVNHLDQVTQQNAAMVQEATAACFALNTDAQQLAQLVARFNTGSSSDVDPVDWTNDPEGPEDFVELEESDVQHPQAV
ncbi:methyl-accepting chemotaxis protein [Algirhabdus cladophorae]|uniref:methyl-accepting chemotaxis protein n=1 Tax=Algirhabdus cladophorae TaxID=3377108 RepID=UPI003B84B4A2